MTKDLISSINKKKFESGERFRVREGGDFYKIVSDHNGREYMAVFRVNKWEFCAFIDVVTDRAIYLIDPANDPDVLTFCMMYFPNDK
jgi:hypothetical protein